MGVSMTRRDHNAQLSSERGLKEQLKAKGSRRRAELKRSASAAIASRRLRNDLLPTLKVVDVQLNQLRSASRKVRKLNVAHAQEVASAIGALGFCQPVLIGKDKVVIDGEVRVEAARLLGLERVPCIAIDHLSEQEQDLLRLAVNRLAEKGEWDLEELKFQFDDLIIADAPIEISGFMVDEIDQIRLDDKPDGVEQGPLAPDKDATAVARIGDVFLLGPHRIICGDATNQIVIRQLMQEANSYAQARMICTDQPFNVPIAGHVSSSGQHADFVQCSGELSEEEFLQFNVGYMEAALPFLTDGGVFGTFIDWRGLSIVHAAAIKLGLIQINLVVWAKTNAGMGSLYRSQHELFPLYKKGNAPSINNVLLGKRGRWRTNLWTFAGASSFGSDARRGLEDHPTVKPCAMLADALLDLTNRNEIVLDPFLGSGSTLVAAETTGRICRGAELDPLYFDLIVRRYESQTGRSGVLAATGETFAEVAARRSREVCNDAEAGREPRTLRPDGEGDATAAPIEDV
jgi:DNA modification methylase